MTKMVKVNENTWSNLWAYAIALTLLFLAILVLGLIIAITPEETIFYDKAYQKGFEAGQENKDKFDEEWFLDSLQDWENSTAEFVSRLCVAEDYKLKNRYFCINKDGTWTASWRSP